jgi:thiol-disulfide isomerase/thioredoxin
MVKYYKISNISFDNEDPLEKVKNHYQEHVNYIKSHLNILQSIDSNYSFGLLYLIIRYDAKIAGHPLENFWEYFDAINEPVKSSFSYKSYIFARLETDEKIKTTELYKQIINKAKKSGINDSRFDSLLISKRNVQNINNLKGKGMVTTTGHPIDYANMISSLKGKYIFVDFWASWCGPCRAQMPIIQSVKEELANENIAFVAVSIDIDKQNNDWLAASKDENLDKEKHNYRLVKGPKNELLQFYKFNSVPRYMLYDKKGALISDNFTSPGNSNFKSELLKHIMN